MAKKKAFAVERWCADGIWRVLKIYPFRAQCIIWCYMHRLVYRHRHHHFLDDTIRIREI